MTTSTNATTTNSSFYAQSGKAPLKLRLFRSYFKLMSILRPTKTAKQLVKIFAHPRVNRDALLERYTAAQFLSNGSQTWFPFEGDDIFVYSEGTPQILLVSGWESSIFRFETIMETLRENNIGFLYFDLPGQGISTGTMNNAIKTSRLIRTLVKNNPTINSILGHSFGGASSIVALFLDNEEREVSDQLTTVVTVGSPSQYPSVVDPFFAFLTLPDRMRTPFLNEVGSYIGIDFRSYDIREMNLPENINIHMFHDKNDTVVSVRDAYRVVDKVNVHITENLGHRRIMHTPRVINEIIGIFLPQLEMINE